MIRRVAYLIVLAAAATALAGCAAGRFIAGAPAPGSTRPAEALLLRRCTGCHEVPVPGEMTATEWQAGLERMKRRMRLPAAEWDSLAAMQAGTDAR